MSAEARSCHSTHECVKYVHNVLHREKLVQHWFTLDKVWGGILIPCKGCDRGDRRRRCQGWRLAFRAENALWLATTDVRGREVHAVLEAEFDVQRPDGWREKWERAPMNKCSTAINLYKPDGSTLLTRQHLDLSNPGQPGPIWHVQLGGKGSDEDKDWVRTVASLRWPALPMDFMLFVELALFLFKWEAWRDLQAQTQWRRYVRSSEQFVLSHYLAALQHHWQVPTSPTSWLGVQCSQTGSLNPRPA